MFLLQDVVWDNRVWFKEFIEILLMKLDLKKLKLNLNTVSTISTTKTLIKFRSNEKNRRPAVKIF